MAHTKNILRESWPVFTIVALCGLIFAVDISGAAGGQLLTAPFMMVPLEVSTAWQSILGGNVNKEEISALATTLTYALLHADAEHLLMNLLLIWVFGSLVLRELGAIWFFGIFIVTAITGGIGQVLLDPASPIPTLGASGALMGLEGAYLGMILRWRLPNPDIWPIAEPIPPGRLAVLAIFGIVMDISGLIGGGAGIAYGAHLGGFIGGLIIATTVIPRPKHAR